MKKRNYKEDWSTYNADADSGLFQKHLKRLAEAKATPSGKATSDIFKTVWTNYGPEGLNKYSYDNYLRDMRTNYPALQPLTKGGFDYNKAKFKDSLDNIRTSITPPTPQAPIDQVPPKENSQKLNRILSYIDQNAEQLKDTAKSSCDKKYGQIYDTVAMAVSGQVTKNSAIIAGQPGIGKCVVNSTRVPLADGSWTTMGEIKKGDVVLTPKGTTAKVLEVYPQPEKQDVYRVTFSDGRFVEADRDQIFKVKRCRFWWDSNEKKRKAEYKYDNETLETLITAWERESKYNQGKNSNKPCFSIPLTQSVVFDSKEELPLDPYLLGLLLGDGGLTQPTPIITSNDKEIIDFVKEAVKPLGLELHQHKGDPITFSIVRDETAKNQKTNPLTDILRNLGLYRKDCFTKFIPEIYKKASVEARKALIQGLADIDGTIGSKVRNTTFCTVSEQLAKDFAEVIYSLGGRCSINKREGRESQNIGSYFYDISFNTNFCPFRLEKKAKRYLKCSQKKRPLENICIKSIEYIGKDDTTCILIDDPDHLYLVNDYVVVHNTHTVTQVLHDRGFSRVLEGNPKPNQYLYNNGSIGTSQESVIWFFYQHRDHEIIVLDDCDGFLATENPSLNNMLKALLTTGKEGGKVTVKDLRLRGRLSKFMEYNEKRTLKRLLRESNFNDVNAFEEIFGKMYNKNTNTYQNQSTDDYEDDVEDSLENEDLRNDEETLETKSEGSKSNLKFPEVFEFTSKVICISNLRLRDIDSAVTSRSNCCEIYLTPAEFMVKLDEIKDTLGNDSCRVDLDVYKWHKDCCIDALEIALEAYEKGITINGRRVEINSDLEFRIITALADYSIAKTKFSGRDVLSYTEDQRWSHIYRLLSENCLDMLAQVK